MSKKRKNNPVGSIALMLVGAVLIFGAAGWYLFANTGQPDTAQPAASQSTSVAEDNYPQIERVSLEDAKTAYDQNSAVFVDVRSEGEYAQGHIPGALNIPLLDLPGRIGELNANDWILTY